MRPIEIIGGGLAGLSLGLALRRREVPVTLHEAFRYPRHRVCGEFIAGLSDTTVIHLGLQPFLGDALLHREVAWFIDQKPSHRETLPEPARAISRHRLDERLARAFTTAGGELRTDSRKLVEEGNGREGCVVTTGRRRSKTDWLGLKIHALNLALHCDLELHLGDDAYIGLTRVEDGRVNACGLFRRRPLAAKGAELVLSYLRTAGLSDLAARLEASQLDVNSFSAVTAVGFDRAVPAANRVSLGDACAMVPPFTGNGMAMAFQSAEIALGPLVNYARGSSSWTETSATIHAALQRRFRLRLATAELLHPFLLRTPRQRWMGRLAQSHLLPFRPLYSALH